MLLPRRREFNKPCWELRLLVAEEKQVSVGLLCNPSQRRSVVWIASCLFMTEIPRSTESQWTSNYDLGLYWWIATDICHPWTSNCRLSDHFWYVTHMYIVSLVWSTESWCMRQSLQYQYDVQKCNVILQHSDLCCGQVSMSGIWWLAQLVLCTLCIPVAGMYGSICYGVCCKDPQNTWVGPHTPIPGCNWLSFHMPMFWLPRQLINKIVQLNLLDCDRGYILEVKSFADQLSYLYSLLQEVRFWILVLPRGSFAVHFGRRVSHADTL